jgi:excisionase family DNA binding protein
MAQVVSSDVERLTLSVEEAAQMLGTWRALVYKLVRRGDLPRLQLGRRIVVPRRALEELVAAAAETTGP